MKAGRGGISGGDACSNRPPGFRTGADISALARLEEDGAIYRDERGEVGDAITLLREAGVDWFRLRLFVDPGGQGLVVNDLKYTTNLARRIKAAGGSWLLDFHYADTWADPGQQPTPRRWLGMDEHELTVGVERYTREVLEHLARHDATPDLVQIGNEISAGMLWPTGKLHGAMLCEAKAFDRLAALLKAGARGVGSASVGDQTPGIVIHLDRGDRWAQSEWFFTEIERRGVPFDVAGFSYYPRFHGSLAEVRENLKRTAEQFRRPVILLEVGASSRGPQWELDRAKLVYPVSPAGQAAFARDVVAAVASLPGGRGQGVFWWHAAAIPTPRNLAWEGGRLGLFDEKGHRLPAAWVLGGQRVPKP